MNSRHRLVILLVAWTASALNEEGSLLQSNHLKPYDNLTDEPDVHKDSGEEQGAQNVGAHNIANKTEAAGNANDHNTNSAKHVTGSAHSAHGFVGLLFFFGILSFGSLVLMFFERYFPSIQSTNVLFVCGVLVSILHHYNRGEHPVWSNWFVSVEMWEHISPHMVFFAFLPVLIFGEAMQLQTVLFKTCFWQVLTLAVPGVLLGTALTASFAKYVFPYAWEWPVALAFGAVLSATDPVSVVALFNTLGVSPRLTMIISGESLLNDGTAICIFVLMVRIIQGTAVTAGGIAVFALHMCFTSVLIGTAMGFGACCLIGICCNGHHLSDSMIQFLVTICCSFMAFFITDAEFSSSGVLAVVSAGLVTAHYAWPRFVNRETILTVWEALLFIANTVIFFLAGLLFTDICLKRRDHISYEDFWCLGLLYVAIHVVRAFMTLVLWYPMQKVGPALSWKEGVVMVFSGLRGAVSLTMAISFDLEPDIGELRGSRFMFHCGGIAVLTMFVNAGLTPALLRLLELTKRGAMKQMVLDNFRAKMQKESRDMFAVIRKSDDIRFENFPEDIIQDMVPGLAQEQAPTDESRVSSKAVLDEAAVLANPLTQIYRECFLKFLQSCYWHMIEEGVLPRDMRVTRLLLQSCEESLGRSQSPISDWETLNRFGDSILEPSGLTLVMNSLAGIFSWWPWFRHTWDMETGSGQLAYASLCYRSAHARARQEVPEYFSKTGLGAQVIAMVHTESTQLCERADAFVLQKVASEVVQVEKAKMAAQKLLQNTLHKVHHMKENGMLNGMEASLLGAEAIDSVRKIIDYVPPAAASTK